jgi:hypothetical protein
MASLAPEIPTKGQHMTSFTRPRRIVRAMRTAHRRSSQKWITRIEAPTLPAPGRQR